MALFRLEVKIIGRASGHKAVAAAAYRAGEKIYDERNEETHDYTRKASTIKSEIFAPAHAPDWVHDRGKLWNAVEAVEDESKRRASAQLAREVLVSLPRELDDEKRWKLLEDFTNKEFVSKGMIADVAYHNPKSADGFDNPHAHIMLTMRDINADGFGKKNRDWNAPFTKDDYIYDKSKLVGLRADWADYVNNSLADNGSEERISHLKNEQTTPHASISNTAFHIDNKGGYSYEKYHNYHLTAQADFNRVKDYFAVSEHRTAVDDDKHLRNNYEELSKKIPPVQHSYGNSYADNLYKKKISNNLSHEGMSI